MPGCSTTQPSRSVTSHDRGGSSAGSGSESDVSTVLERLSEAQNHRCAYCGPFMSEAPLSPLMATVDRVVPRSLGGNEWDYLVAACWACNMGRSNGDALEYYERVMAHGPPALRPGQRGPHPRILSPDERRALCHFGKVLTRTQRHLLLQVMVVMNARLAAESKPTLHLKDVMQEVLARGIGPDVRFAALPPDARRHLEFHIGTPLPPTRTARRETQPKQGARLLKCIDHLQQTGRVGTLCLRGSAVRRCSGSRKHRCGSGGGGSNPPASYHGVRQHSARRLRGRRAFESAIRRNRRSNSSTGHRIVECRTCLKPGSAPPGSCRMRIKGA